MLAIDDHEIDEDPGDLHVLSVQRIALCHALHLHDDDAASTPRGLRHRQHFAEDCLFLHRYVAVLIGRRAAQEGDGNRHRLEQKPFFAGKIDHFHEIGGRAGTLPRALVPRVDERIEARLRDEARATGGHVAHQLRQRALRQRVRLDLVLRRQRHEPGRVHECARDCSL